MTAAFVWFWALAVAFAALGLWAVAAVAVLLAVLCGARHWIVRKAREAVGPTRPIRID